MTDRPEDPETPLAPFPFTNPGSPFPPLDHERVDPARDAMPDQPNAEIAAVSARDLPTSAAARAQPMPLLARPVLAQPLIAFGRFAFPPGPPTDDDGLSARDRRWASRTIVIAAGFLLIFNAVSIQNWSRQQTPGWLTTTVRRLADVWGEQIALLGADQPREAVRDGYEAARDGP